MQEFRINDYISLSLKGEKTIIYVNNEEFMQCKSLLLNIPTDNAQFSNLFKSIDEAAEIFQWSEDKQETFEYALSSEVEFWGHCSNLQAWVESDYDTRLLHSNLAFPLLRKLGAIGEPKAARVFKLEILRRFNEGNNITREFLIENEYLDYLEEEDVRSSLLIEEVLLLEDLEKYLQKSITLTEYLEGITDGLAVDCYYIEDYKIIGLKIRTLTIDVVPELIGKFKNLRYLNLSHNYLKYLPASIGKLKNLEILNLARNEFEKIPLSFRNLEKLRELNLKYNKLRKVPSMLGNIKTLYLLYLDDNPIDYFPKKLGNLMKEDKNSRYKNVR